MESIILSSDGHHSCLTPGGMVHFKGVAVESIGHMDCRDINIISLARCKSYKIVHCTPKDPVLPELNIVVTSDDPIFRPEYFSTEHPYIYEVLQEVDEKGVSHGRYTISRSASVR